MKFVAILKDSFREAVDCKALYVLLALSAVVILLTASISFELVPAQKTMEDLVSGNVADILGGFRDAGAFEEAPAARQGVFQLDSLRVVRGRPDQPDSEYALTVSMQASDKDAAKIRQAPAEAIERLKQRFAMVQELNLLKVKDVRLVPAAAAGKVRFEVYTEPTPATRRLWRAEPSLFFGALPIEVLQAPLGLQLYVLASSVMSMGSWVAVLVGVIITAFFIPNMLRKGTIDLMLVKPVHRWAILLFKYLGGLTFVLLNTAIAIAGIWLVLGLRTGIWANSFLLMILVITFYFAVLYAVSALISVLTNSAVVAILVTCGAWLVFTVIGQVHLLFDVRQQYERDKKVPAEKRWGDNPFAKTIDIVYAVTPRTSDLKQISEEMLRNDFLTGEISRAVGIGKTSVTLRESVTVSGIFVAVMLGLACWWFATKDY